MRGFDLIISPTEYEEWQRGEGLWFRVLGPMPTPTDHPIKEFQYETATGTEKWWVAPEAIPRQN
jgi:hypothetical protein